MFLLDGKQLNMDVPFTIGETAYPSNWLRLTTIEEKNAVGITEVPDPQVYDRRYFLADGADREIDAVRTEVIPQIKLTLANVLNSTDWALLRKIETGQDVPEKIVAIRNQARAESDRLTSAIMQAQSIAELITVIDSQQWPTLD